MTRESSRDAKRDSELQTLALSATPADAPADRPLEITLTGLSPGQRVTVSAAFADLESRWRCEATFEADDAGVVDLTERAPVAGDYDGVRPMGLVQLATEAEDADDDSPANDSATETDDDRYELHLTAQLDGERVAETTVTRRVRAPGVERIELDPERDGVAGELFVPSGDGPHPGVVVLHGSGGDPKVRLGKALASRGYAAVALRYFGDPEPVPDHFAEVPVSYVGRAIDWLRQHDAVRDGTVGVLGTSRGTELAVLTAGQRHDVGAVAAYAPSAYVWPGERPDDEWPAAWTLGGDPLRPVPRPDGEPTPARTERGVRSRPIFETCVAEASLAERERAALPVENVAADVLLVSGGDDGIWHADEMAETLEERLRDDAPTDEVGHVSHEDAGHHAAPPYVPTTGRTVMETDDDGPDMIPGGTPEGIAEMEVRGWRAVLDTFGDALGDD